ncbi:MAG: hypothetical protein Q9181_004780, partial [Wetmoreana brouardii]
LLYLYSSTLDKLSNLPEHSVYRQSAEAITKHRLSIVDSIKPQGYEEWAQRAQKNVDEHPEVFGKDADVRKIFVPAQLMDYVDELDVEWNGNKMQIPSIEGTRTDEEKERRSQLMKKSPASAETPVQWENEPPLEASQVAEIEDKIGGGLIEEVILVAEGEHKLVDTMLESRSWEELKEKPPNAIDHATSWVVHYPLTQYTEFTQHAMAAPAATSKKTTVDDKSSVEQEIPYAGPTSDSFILGVQIACPYDIHRNPQPRFSVYPTPTADFQTQRQPSAPLMSARIKIPLALHISNTDRTKAQYANYHAENLMRVGYTELADWGKIPRHVRNPGSMLVFRQDGKPLLPQHVEAFCA